MARTLTQYVTKSIEPRAPGDRVDSVARSDAGHSLIAVSKITNGLPLLSLYAACQQTALPGSILSGKWSLQLRSRHHPRFLHWAQLKDSDSLPPVRQKW